MKSLGTFCGHVRTAVAAFTLVTLAALAAGVSTAGAGGPGGIPGLPGTPTVPGVPAAPALPPITVAPGVPALPAAAVASTATKRNGSTVTTVQQLKGRPLKLPAHTITVNAVLTVRVRLSHSKSHAKPTTTTSVTLRVNGKKVSLKGRRLSATPSCPQDTTTDTTTDIHCVNQPWDAPLSNNCPGANDVVETQGTFQYMIQSTFDPLAGTMTTAERLNWQNVRGYVTDSAYPEHIGNKYQANDTEKTYQNVYPVGLSGVAITTDHDENNELISLGPLPNQIIHMMTHTAIVIDSTGLHVSPPTVQGPGIKCTG